MDDDYIQFSPKVTYGNPNKRNLVKKSPKKLTFTGNFTPCHRHFYITESDKRNSLRLDILNAVMKRTETKMHQKDIDDSNDNPLYEDPRDIIAGPVKPPRKRNIRGAMADNAKEGKHSFKEQKKKLSKKYERLITALMDRCEENIVSISEKDAHIAKLKEKLKTILEYNKLFASENDRLKCEHATLLKYAEECKTVIKEEREKNVDLEDKCKSLQERVRQYDIPDKDQCEPTTAIPLVEVCMSCSSRQIVLNQARELNSRLQKDMQALKDVLYRLNVQLARYQEKIRSNVPTLKTDKHTDKYDCIDSLINAGIGQRRESIDTEAVKKDFHEETHGRVVDLSGLLSAQALAPLFDAYQDNLQEKDNLINDYEKQFENMNKKSKLIVNENKSLCDKVSALENELCQVRQSYKKLLVERETADIEKKTLHERAERAESKLKEVYELYEDKMAAMIRDYETVHREYFAVKTALEASAGKISQLDALRARTVPADMHERRLDHCKRLLEELKHQYSMENERKSEQVKKMQEDVRSTEEKYNKLCQENEAVKEELKAALKNVRVYRRAAVIFRQRARTSAASAVRARRARSKRTTRGDSQPLQHALHALDTIKTEIKAVKSRAYTSLEELERRIVQQERRAAAAQADHRREMERAALALQHKEAIIRSLIDKVADVEEVRLSQTNAHRLQGIVSDSSSESSSTKDKVKKDTKQSVKLVPSSGGYYQDKDKRKGIK